MVICPQEVLKNGRVAQDYLTIEARKEILLSF